MPVRHQRCLQFATLTARQLAVLTASYSSGSMLRELAPTWFGIFHPRDGANMVAAPKWLRPVAIAALVWNLLGCFAYLSDVTLTPEDLGKMSAAQQALYASRPAWAVGATAFAVWGGALGCVGLILRKRWATPLFMISLAGVVVQDIALFGLSGAAAQAEPTAIVLQGLVLVIAVALVILGRKAGINGHRRS